MSSAKSKERKGVNLGTLRLKDELQKKEDKFENKDDMFGPMLLTNPGYISSARGIMFTSHLKQAVNLDEPEIPRVFTNYENLVGKYSTGYKKAKRNYVVTDRIAKFADGVNDDQVYALIMYDEETDYYDIMIKQNVEDLTEKFGFSYDNTTLDTKVPGSVIRKDEVLVKTSSYDEDMNYRYGKNVTFAYMLDPNTIEDAIRVSRSLATTMTSKEIETVRVSLNDNDIFVNLYGDSQNYKAFPDINDMSKKVLCAKRRIHNNQLLYDLKSSNLRRINFNSDVPYFIDGRIVDITVYCNKPLDEVPDNSFNRQLKHYLTMQQQYYEKLRDACRRVIDSGSEYSSDINFHYRKAMEYLDDKYKWRDENHSVFNNMNIEFVVERSVGLSEGQKLTGRYGNKGVISQIVEDDEMPFLENGKRVDVIFNLLGVINRLNPQQLFEQSITFVCDRVCEYMVKNDLPLEEREKLLIDIVTRFNEKQGAKVAEFIGRLSKDQRLEFMEETIKNGVLIHNPPLWEEHPMFDILRKIYADYPWITPYDVYVNRFGRTIKIMKPMVVGSMYVIKLKQTSKKGFSARSTGSLSRRGLPEKSNKAKTHQEQYSKTPIRMGDQENINSAIGVPSEIMANIHLYYRSSMIGRRELAEQLMTNIKPLEEFPHSKEFTNRNMEILQAYLKALGLHIKFHEDRQEVKFYTDDIMSFKYGGKTIISTMEEYEKQKRMIDARTKYEDGEEMFIGTKDEFQERIKAEAEEIKRREGKTIVRFE